MLDEAVSGVLGLAQDWGVPVPREAAKHMAFFLTQLLRWNQRINLTGARTLRELLEDHLPDSFALARLCPKDATVADVGAGGGLPAIPFALIRPDCQVTLVEPRAKRVAFLNAAIRQCGSPSLKALRARVEDLEGSSFAVAASRATFPPGEWLLHAMRILGERGLAIAFATALPECSQVPPLARCVSQVSYLTAGGAPRWAGAFSFT